MLQKHKHLLLQMFNDTQTFYGKKKNTAVELQFYTHFTGMLIYFATKNHTFHAKHISKHNMPVNGIYLQQDLAFHST